MLEYSIGQGYSALDAQAWRDKLDGFAVASGLTPSAGSTGLEVDIASGTATVGETSGSVDTVSLGSTTTITLDSADSTNPRKDVVYIDTAGTLQKETGIAESALPDGNDRFDTYQPEPPLPSTEGTVLAEVWVAAGASSLSSSDVRDRRAPADVVGDRGVFDTVSTEEGPSNILNASPGEVQSKIDSATSTSGETVVRLDSGATYDPASPWAVKQGVTLVLNGADVVLSSDIDVFHVYPGGHVRGPGLVDYSGVTYSSTVISYDTAFAGQYNNDPGLRASALGFDIEGTTGEGTVVHVHESQGTGLYFTHTDVSKYHVGTVVRFEVSADGGSCNANVASGTNEHYETGVVTTDTSTNGGAVAGNIAGSDSTAWQPNTSGASTRLWDLQDGSRNIVQGYVWDRGDYSAETWRIGSTAGTENVIQTRVPFQPVDITDNANDPTNTVESTTQRVTDPLQKVVALGGNQSLGSGLTDSVVLGEKADVSSGDNATVVGSEATANGDEAVAIGYLTSVSSAGVSKIQGSRGDGIVLPATEGGNQTTELENGTITFEASDTDDDGVADEVVLHLQDGNGNVLSGTVSLS